MATVLSVGQCGYDDSRIGKIVRDATGAFLDRAGDGDEARQMMRDKKYDLVLVNRVFDGGAGMGLDFIAELKNNGDATPVMLVSDYADAQASAISAGALPGFGKASMYGPDVAEKLRSALGNTAKA